MKHSDNLQFFRVKRKTSILATTANENRREDLYLSEVQLLQ